jgi:hypothetical protein
MHYHVYSMAVSDWVFCRSLQMSSVLWNHWMNFCSSIKHTIAGKTRLIGIYDHWFLSQKLDFAHALLSIFLSPCCVLGFNPANVLSFVAFVQMDFYMSQVHCFILSYMFLVGSNQSNTNMHAISLLILLCGFSCIIGLRPI